MAATEFEEWRVEQACKLIRGEENYLSRTTTDNERRFVLLSATHWTTEQIEVAITAIRINGGDVGEG